MVSSVVSKRNLATTYSILTDETTDISCIEQLSLCVRYVNKDNLKLCEDFLKFFSVTNLTGESLAQTLFDYIKNPGIDLAFMVGQVYDGAASMSGRFNSVQAHVRKLNDMAIYVHCAFHSFNLAISDACVLQSIRNCLGVFGTVYNFFNTTKLQEVLLRKITNVETSTKTTRFKNICPTRCVQRL